MSLDSGMPHLPRRLAWTTLALAFGVATLDGLDAQLMAIAAPAVAGALVIPRSALGPILSAALIGMAIGAVLFGTLGDRIGRRRVLILCTVLFGVGTLLTALASSVTALIALRLLTGLGLGGALPNAVTLVAETAPPAQRPLYVTAMYLGFPAGGLLGGIFAAPILTAFGWPGLFVLGGVLPLALVPALCLWLRESPSWRPQEARPARARSESVPDEQRVGPRSVLGPKYLRNTLLLWLIFFINLLVLFFLMSWLPTLLVDRGMAFGDAMRLVVAFNLGGGIGGVALAVLTLRYDPRRTLAVFFALGAFSYAALGYSAGNAATLWACALATGVFAGGAQVGLYPLTTRLYDTSVRATGVGMAQAWGRVGSIAGPLLGGLVVAAQVPFAVHFLLFAAPLLLAAGASAALREAHPEGMTR